MLFICVMAKRLDGVIDHLLVEIFLGKLSRFG
jgi:hypothetical protein